MPSELRICPHCGSAVSGDNTKRCPRCDGLLTETADADVKTIIGSEADFQARTLLETEDQIVADEPIVSPEPAYEPMATVIDSQLEYVSPTDELERVLNEQPIEFQTEKPQASIFQAQTIVGLEDEPPIAPKEDSEPVGIVDSTPNEFQPPIMAGGMKTMIDDKPPMGFSEARTEAFQQPPVPSATPAHGSPMVTIPAEKPLQTVPNTYAPQYAPPAPQPMPSAMPRAPYTPPPAAAMPHAPSMAYAQPAAPPRQMPMQGWGAPQPTGPSDYWLRQRTQTYLNGGYKL